MPIEITSQFNNKAGKPLDVNSIKATIAERDAITDRYIGLRVYVEKTSTEYVLKDGITNNDWVEEANITKNEWISAKEDINNIKGITYGHLYNQVIFDGQSVASTRIDGLYANAEVGTGYTSNSILTLVGGDNNFTVRYLLIGGEQKRVIIVTIGTNYSAGVYSVIGGTGTGMKIRLYVDVDDNNNNVYFVRFNEPRIYDIMHTVKNKNTGTNIELKFPTYDDIQELLTFTDGINNPLCLIANRVYNETYLGTDDFGFNGRPSGRLQADNFTHIGFGDFLYIPIQTTYKYDGIWSPITAYGINVASNTGEWILNSKSYYYFPIRLMLSNINDYYEGLEVLDGNQKYTTIKIGNQVWIVEPIVNINDLQERNNTVASYSNNNDNNINYSILKSYVHPDKHPPSIIAETTDDMFVSQIEKTTWNAKLDSITKSNVESVLTGDIITHTHDNKYQIKPSTFIIEPYNIVWEGDWIKVKSGGGGHWHNAYYDYVMVTMDTGSGTVTLPAKIRVPNWNSPEVFGKQGSPEFSGFYLKVLNNYLTPESNIHRIIVNFHEVTQYRPLYVAVNGHGVSGPATGYSDWNSDGDVRKWNAPNVIVDDTLLGYTDNNGVFHPDVEHGIWMKITFLWYYNTILSGSFTGQVLLTEDDPTLSEPNFEGGGKLDVQQYPKYCRDNEADLIMEAFQYSLFWLSEGANPDILTFVCHFSNSPEEWNYQRNDTTITGIPEIDRKFPLSTIGCGAGNLNDANASWQSSYGEGVEFIEPTNRAAIGSAGGVNWNDSHQQSPAVAIIGAKFKYIKNETNVSWNTVRLACRATATQSTYNIANNIKWDKYRGFGVIDCAAAITWINNLKASFKAPLKERYEEGNGYCSFMDSVDDFTNNTPLPKRLTQEKIIFNNNIEQQSLVDTDKIITQNVNGVFKWISHLNLKNQFTTSIIQTTYESLKTLKTNGKLKVGQYYQFDYTTRHKINNTNVINEGVVERLIIFTTSTSTFHKNVYSLDYPNDEITYDFNNNICEDNITPRRGWITRRKDTVYNNEVIGLDFRNYKIRRYKVANIVPFDSGISYTAGQLFSFNSLIYLCISDSTIGDVPTNNILFTKICGVNDYICYSSTSTPMIKRNNSQIINLQGDINNYMDYYIFQTISGSQSSPNITNNVFTYSDMIGRTIYISDYLMNNKFVDSGYTTFLNTNITNCGLYNPMRAINSTIINSTLTDVGNLSIRTWIYNSSITNTILHLNTTIIDSIIQNNIRDTQLLYVELYNTIIKNNYYDSNILNNNIFINKTITNKSINGYVTIGNVNFTLATHIFASYYCEIYFDENNVYKLRYTDTDGIIQITDITA